MVNNKQSIIALDVGEKRIGVAWADLSIRIASPVETIEVDQGNEYTAIDIIAKRYGTNKVVIGYPRNQSGEPTRQTEYSILFGDELGCRGYDVVYQDESLTSVFAENMLKSTKKPYTKADIDKHAAALILQDYLEML